MRDLGIGSWIERRARVSPDHPAIVSGAVTRTYGEVAARVLRLAHGLRALGLRRGDRVGWLGSNHSAFLETLFVAAKLGAVLSPVNHRVDPAAVDRTLADSGARIVVGTRESVRLASAAHAAIRVTVDGEGEGSIAYESLLAGSPDDPIDEPVGLDDLCFLPHTSGTTGAAKGVMLTHGNVTWNVVNLLASADFRADDVTIAVAPFFRVGGTGVNVLPVLFKGGTVVIPSVPGADEILRLIESHRVTVGFANPDLLEELARSPRWPAADTPQADAAGADGERTGAAFVVLEAGAAVSARALLDFCRQSLAEHEVPRSITFVERLPRTSVGKLVRAELRRLTRPNGGLSSSERGR